MKTTIPNWTGAASIGIAFQPAEDGLPNLVVETQHGGSMNFTFAMTPAQARAKAAALIQAANLAECSKPFKAGIALESGEFIPADELNKGKTSAI